MLSNISGVDVCLVEPHKAFAIGETFSVLGDCSSESAVILTTCCDLESVLKKGKNHGQALLGTGFAAGKVDDDGTATQAGDAPRQPCAGILLRAERSHGFSQSGNVAFYDVKGRLRRAIAWAQPGTPDREDELRSHADPLQHSGNDLIFVVGDNCGGDARVRPTSSEDLSRGGAGGIGHQALRTAIGYGEDGQKH